MTTALILAAVAIGAFFGYGNENRSKMVLGAASNLAPFALIAAISAAFVLLVTR